MPGHDASMTRTVWYYTRGDRSEPGQERWDGWGFVASGYVRADTRPWPGMPRCTFAADPACRVSWGEDAGRGRHPAARRPVGQACAHLPAPTEIRRRVFPDPPGGRTRVHAGQNWTTYASW